MQYILQLEVEHEVTKISNWRKRTYLFGWYRDFKCKGIHIKKLCRKTSRADTNNICYHKPSLFWIKVVTVVIAISLIAWRESIPIFLATSFVLFHVVSERILAKNWCPSYVRSLILKILLGLLKYSIVEASKKLPSTNFIQWYWSSSSE